MRVRALELVTVIGNAAPPTHLGIELSFLVDIYQRIAVDVGEGVYASF